MADTVEELVVKISADITKLSEGMKDAAAKVETGSRHMADSADKLHKGMGATLGKLKTGLLAVGTAAVAMAGTAVAGILKVANTADNIDELSQKIGISTDAFQEWNYVLSQNGIEVSALQPAMKTLSNAAVAAKDGGSDAAKAFQTLGVKVTDAGGKMRTQESILADVITGLQGMDDATSRTALATQLLGRGATELGPILNMTQQDLAAVKKEARDAGAVMSKETVAAGAKLADTLQKIKDIGAGLLGSALTPILEVAQKIAESFAKYLPDLMTQLSPLLQMAGEFAAMLFDELFPVLKNILPIITKLAQMAFPILTQAVQAIMPFIDTVVVSFGSFLTALMELVNQSGVVQYAIKAIGVALSTLGFIIQTVLGFFTAMITSVVNGVEIAILDIKLLTSKSKEEQAQYAAQIISKNAQIKAAWDNYFSSVGKNATDFYNGIVGGAKKATSANLTAAGSFDSTRDAIDLAAARLRGYIGVIDDTNQAYGRLKGLPTFGPNFPTPKTIGPYMANGGIVGRATNAIIGEDGAEAVVPLTKPGRAREVLNAAGIGGQPINVTIPISIGGKIIETIGLDLSKYLGKQTLNRRAATGVL